MIRIIKLFVLSLFVMFSSNGFVQQSEAGVAKAMDTTR